VPALSKAVGHLAKDRAAQLPDALKKELLLIPERQQPNANINRLVVRGDGHGKRRYQLKRWGLIGMGHADGKGRALVWRTPLGQEVAKIVAKDLQRVA
jgi:hypothetical protein